MAGIIPQAPHAARCSLCRFVEIAHRAYRTRTLPVTQPLVESRTARKGSVPRGNIYQSRKCKGREMKLPKDTRQIGLARALSKLGYCSRSQAAELIRAGRVRLNGALRTNPEAPVRLHRDLIAVDGLAVRAAPKIYLLMNKPRGVVTTASDEAGRETVYSSLDKKLPWVGPVGRLDRASEGLLLFTNDSEWASRISDPRTHLDKTYHVQVGALGDETLASTLVKGVRTSSREMLRAKRAHVLRTGERNAWLEIVLDEGKNRQIRRMLEALEIKVLRLVRIAVGPVQLGHIAKGEFRALTSEEKRLLDQASEISATRLKLRARM
jgi:23S rRNA pseudouridine2605 synthase